MGGRYEIVGTNDFTEQTWPVHVFTNSWFKAMLAWRKAKKYNYHSWTERR